MATRFFKILTIVNTALVLWSCDSKMKVNTKTIDQEASVESSDASDAAIMSPNVDSVLKAPFTGASLYMWTQVSGPGKLNFESPEKPETKITADEDGSYVARLTAVMENGEKKKKDFNLEWDTTAPAISSIQLANEAADGIVTANELASPKAVLTVDVDGYSAIYYTRFIQDHAGVDCTKLPQSAYNQSSAPTIINLPVADGDYVVCVNVVDDAGNYVYRKSPVISRNTQGAPISVAPLVETNAVTTLSLSASDAKSVQWVQIDGPGTLVIANSQSAQPTVSGTVEGTYHVRATVTDSKGNKSQADVTFILDKTPPAVVSFNAAGIATSGYINANGASSQIPAYVLVPNADASVVSYSALLNAGIAQTCDGSKTYNQSAPPVIADFSSDGSYLICAKMIDAAGNIAYAQSPIIIKDTTAPTFISLLAANGASDGYVNASETGSLAAIVNLTASGNVSADYSDILDNSSAIICDNSRNYSHNSVPAINSMPAIDGQYAVCVRIQDAAGNIAYGKSQTIVRDTAGPVLNSLALANGATDGFINSGESSSALAVASLSASDYVSVSYSNMINDASPVSCDGSITYGNANIPAINSMASDGVFALCVKLIDVAGNISYGKSQQVTRDSVAPVFTSLLGVNGASDGYVNSSEYLSPAALVSLNASGYASAQYSGVLASSSTCDQSQTYSSSSSPAISDIPGADGSYAVCVKLMDAAGNATYGKSASIVRDTIAPVVTSFNSANEAADGYINGAEAASSLAFASLVGSGYTTASYSAILDNTSSITCDGLQNYSNGSIPVISSMGADASYALCAKLVDAAGNIAYAKSNNVVKDTVVPTVNAGSDILANVSTNTAASASGATSYSWSKSSGPGTITFGAASSLNTSISASTDGIYGITLTATDAAGNSSSGSFNFTWDTTAPAFTSLNGANGASDGIISALEVSSSASLLSLNASGYNTVAYTAVMSDTVPNTCNSSQSYSNGSIPLINSVPASDGVYAVCVKLTDTVGNISYGKSQVITRSVVPLAPTNLNAANNAGAVDLSWTAGGGAEIGFLLVRSLSPITFSPTDGQSYSVGSLDANHTLIYKGSSFSVTDNQSVATGTTYYYAVFAYNEANTYTTSSTKSIFTPVAVPSLVWPFDFALSNNTSFNLRSLSTGTGTRNFEFLMSSTVNFASGNKTYTVSGVAAGSNGQVSVPQADLVHGTVYWWKARVSADGGSTWTAYSSARSFRIDTTQNKVGWHMETYDQLNTVPAGNISNLTLASTNNGELYLQASQTVGTYKSPAINMSDLGWGNWGMALATWYTSAPGGATNSYTFQVEYFDGSTWALIPSATFPGNAGNGSTLHVNLDSINAATYPTIRFSIRLWRDSTATASPKCFNITMIPRSASQGSNFVNGGFESANAGEWVTIRSGNGNEPTVDLAKADGTAHSGTKYAYINHNLTGYLTSREAYVYQTITVPVTATTLTFWRKYWRDAYGAGFRMFINDTLKETLLSSATTWTQFSYDITAYQGQTITFTFGMFDYYWAGAGDHGAWMGIDDVQVQ